MHVFQVGVDRFPPLRSLNAFPGNLPVQVTGFVGRDQELGECTKALEASRVVTVTGVGGVGKTRLALQVAAEVLPRFGDGAWLVEFAGVGDPATVEEATATALGVQARTNQPLATTLADFLRTKRLLVVLDNCEHLVGAVATLVERVVAGCPHVVVLTTSRESLAVSGEHLLPLPPMQLPAADALDAVASCEAVRLFLARARDVRPGLAVTEDNAASLGQLCRRLDGIPLAIELAAARVRSMSLADIVSHLDRRFRLLTGGRRSALSRQQTLRGAIGWSFDLLANPERVLLRRLAVFAGGFDLAAAERVNEGGPVDALDVAVLLDHLVDKSLVVADPSGPSSRFRLLEMIRDYTWDRLGESGETDDLSRRHAQYYQAFAAAADRGLRGPDEVSWTEQVERDLDNLRAHPRGVHYAFTNTMTDEESAALYERYAVPGPGRAVFQAALANFNPHAATKIDFHSDDRAPLLLIAGEVDHTAPVSITRREYKLESKSKAITAFKEFAGRSHYTIGQPGWEAVADFALEWALHPKPIDESL
jgi:predicted ATPase